MKLSKSILAAVVVGASITAITSCTKERIQKEEDERIEHEEPVCGFGEKGENPWEDCPACGLG